MILPACFLIPTHIGSDVVDEEARRRSGVWSDNLDQEFRLIQSVLPRYPIAALDTEFPGLVFTDVLCYPFCVDSARYYRFLKTNVNALNIIQVGLALSDSKGNMPTLGTQSCHVWEFNFRDFDLDSDLHSPPSIALLMEQGIDFKRNKKDGIYSWEFARYALSSGLIFNGLSSPTWVTFQSAYDFGFMVKILGRRQLPDDLESFKKLVSFYFGTRVFDIKYMMRFCDGLFGGLEMVAQLLSVERVAGRSHQAGSDSLLTLQTFLRLRDVYFHGKKNSRNKKHLAMFQGLVFGIENQ